MSENILFIGTYSQHASKGIYTARVEPRTGAMAVLSTTTAENASFLKTSGDGRFLFTVHETYGATGGSASAFAITDDHGTLAPLNSVTVRGQGPCHLARHPSGDWLVASCYGNGVHSVLPVRSDGHLGEPSATVTNPGTPGPNQKGGHAHSSVFSPDGKFVLACDLGLDRVLTYGFDERNGAMTFLSAAEMPPGAGPRHIALHPTLPVVYVIAEHACTVTVLHRDARAGTLTARQTVSTLPEPLATALKGGRFANTCADLHVSADGRFVYGSNRGHDSIAAFKVGRDGDLALLGTTPTGGKTPRNFALLPPRKDGAGGDLLLAANQESDSVVAFRRDRNGVPVRTGDALSVPVPVCVEPWMGKHK